MGEKTVRVEESVWAILMDIKIRERKKTLNDVIEDLLRKYKLQEVRE